MPRRSLLALLPDLDPLRDSRSYRLLTMGQLAAQTGSQLRLVAIPFQVYLLTGSSLHVGLIGLFQLIPLLLFQLAGGVIADAVDRRRALLLTQSGLMLTSLALAVVAYAGIRDLAILYALTALGATFTALDSPIRGALVPTLVRRDQIPAAITINQVNFQLAIICGPAAGGLAIAVLGVPGAFALSAAALCGAMLASARIGPVPRPERAAGAAWSFGGALVEGIRHLLTNRALLPAMLLDVAAMALAFPIALFPFYADQVFHVGPQGIGLLYAAPGVGALVAALLSRRLIRVRRPGGPLVATVAVWGACLAAFGLVGESGFVVALVLVAVAFGMDALSAILRQTILQSQVSDEMRGRLTSIFGLFAFGGPTLGQIRAGGVAALTSPQVAMVGGGISVVVAALCFALFARSLMRYELPGARSVGQASQRDARGGEEGDARRR